MCVVNPLVRAATTMGTAVLNVCSSLGESCVMTETGDCGVAGVSLISRMMQMSRQWEAKRGCVEHLEICDTQTSGRRVRGVGVVIMG
jgi:hypothetical protein